MWQSPRAVPPRRSRSPKLCSAIATIALLVSGLRLDAQQPNATGKVPLFETDIRPILAQHCWKCHSGFEPKGGVDLRGVFLMTETRHRSAVVIPGEPSRSLVITRLRDGSMPPAGPLPEAEIQMIHHWIAAGCQARAPRTVYGASIYRTWGVAFSALAIVNILVVSVMWRGELPAGPLLIVVSGLPILACEALQYWTYPPDLWVGGAIALYALSVGVGGSMLAVRGGRPLGFGVLLGLLSPLGLSLLVRRRPDGRVQAVEVASSEESRPEGA